MRIHDISVAIEPDMVTYPGDAGVALEAVARMSDGGVADVSALTLGTHTGTHVDPPSHFIPGGMTVDEIPLDQLVGPCIVVDARSETKCITRAFLNRSQLPDGVERVLFRTRNSALWAKNGFARDFVYIEPDAARWLAERNVRVVGIDYLSVERFGFDHPETHTTLLGAGTIIIEGLDLSRIEPGPYTLVCLPLKVVGGDGAPARVALIEADPT